jgi:hypothetical protein
VKGSKGGGGVVVCKGLSLRSAFSGTREIPESGGPVSDDFHA